MDTNFDSSDDSSLNSDDVEYDMLVQECQELIEQYQNLKQDNCQKMKNLESDLNADFESEVDQKSDMVHVDKAKSEQCNDWKLESIEQVWEELIKEKKVLEEQWTDVNLDLRKKQNQLDEYKKELKNTKEQIDVASNELKAKEDFVKMLRESMEKIKQQK